MMQMRMNRDGLRVPYMPDDVIERDAEVTKLNHAIEWLEMDPVAIGKGD